MITYELRHVSHANEPVGPEIVLYRVEAFAAERLAVPLATARLPLTMVLERDEARGKRLFNALCELAEVDANRTLKWISPEDPGDPDMVMTTRLLPAGE